MHRICNRFIESLCRLPLAVVARSMRAAGDTMDARCTGPAITQDKALYSSLEIVRLCTSRHPSGFILHSSTLNANKCEDIQDDVQRGATSTLDPGRHLAGLDVARLLSLHLPWVTSDAASCVTISKRIVRRTAGCSITCRIHPHGRVSCTRPVSRLHCEENEEEGTQDVNMTRGKFVQLTSSQGGFQCWFVHQ